MFNINNKIFGSDKPVKGLDKVKFYHRPRAQKSWGSAKEKLLDRVRNKCSQSVRASLLDGKTIATKVDNAMLKKSKTKSEQTACLDSL